MKYRFKTRPYKHQSRTLKRAIRKRAIALLWEPGTGKSKFIVDWACALFQLKRIKKVLIVAPLSVVGVWKEEWPKHATSKFDLFTIDRKTTTIHHRKDRLAVVVANYDILWRRPELVFAYKPDLVVADESHRIKKPGARRSRFMRRLNDVPYRAILTGTPTPKSLLDLYGQWVFLNPKRFGERKSKFERRYIVYGGYMGKEIRGYSNVKELKEKVRKDASVVRKDTALDLPSKSYQRIPVELEGKALKLYYKMATELYAELKSGEIIDIKNAAVKVLKLQQLTGGWVHTNEGLARCSQAKMKVMTDILEDRYATGAKLVVFSRFLSEVDAIYTAAGKLGPAYVLRGGMGPDERDEARNRFQQLPGPAVFVAQISTGGLGITLHSASEAVFYSPSWALDDYIQACDRLHRIGQEDRVIYRHLVAVGTVDTDIYAALREKADVMKLIMGDPSRLTKGREVR